MKDRSVEFPNRYRLVKVAGTDDVFDFVPAPGEISEEGTFINKATLLKDVTAGHFGLGTDAVPDDVFGWLGKYNQHWWKRKEAVVYNDADNIVEHSSNSSAQITAIYYGANFVYSDGVFTISSPSNMGFSAANISDIKTAIANKYFMLGSSSGDVLYFAGKNTSGSFSITSEWVNAKWEVTISNATTVAYYEAEYVFSTDRNAYPDGGSAGGFSYEYIGVPFQNAVTAPKIATGSYTGTGTYGKDNPNSLTFDFAPQLVRIELEEGSNDGFTAIRGMTRVASTEYNTQSSHRPYLTWNGNTLEWYSEQDQYKQLNGTYKYKYFAIG